MRHNIFWVSSCISTDSEPLCVSISIVFVLFRTVRTVRSDSDRHGVYWWIACSMLNSLSVIDFGRRGYHTGLPYSPLDSICSHHCSWHHSHICSIRCVAWSSDSVVCLVIAPVTISSIFSGFLLAWKCIAVSVLCQSPWFMLVYCATPDIFSGMCLVLSLIHISEPTRPY